MKIDSDEKNNNNKDNIQNVGTVKSFTKYWKT